MDEDRVAARWRAWATGGGARLATLGGVRLATLGAALAAALIGGRVALRVARMGLDAGRFVRAALTLRLYRRCPDCRRWLRGDAMVCSRCGFRRRSRRRWPRARGRF